MKQKNLHYLSKSSITHLKWGLDSGRGKWDGKYALKRDKLQTLKTGGHRELRTQAVYRSWKRQENRLFTASITQAHAQAHAALIVLEITV